MKKNFIQPIIIILVFLFSHNFVYSQDLDAGKKAFAKCKACHSIKEGGKKRVVPKEK